MISQRTLHRRLGKYGLSRRSPPYDIDEIVEEVRQLLDMITHFKPTETFQYPPWVKKGFVKGEALRLLRTNSTKKTFEENIDTFKTHLMNFLMKLYLQYTLRSEIWRKETGSPPTEQYIETNLALRNTISPRSSKPKRNPNEQMVLNTATTINKRNFQGTAHNVIQCENHWAVTFGHVFRVSFFYRAK